MNSGHVCVNGSFVCCLPPGWCIESECPGPLAGRGTGPCRSGEPELAAAQAAVEAAAARARQAGALPPTRSSATREQTSGAGLTNWQNIALLEQRLDFGGQRGARQEARKIASRSRHGAGNGQRRSSTRRPERMPQPSPPISVPRGAAKGPRRHAALHHRRAAGRRRHLGVRQPADRAEAARYATPRRGGAPAADRPPGPCDAAGRHRRLGADARASAGRGARDRPRRSAARFLARSGHSLPSGYPRHSRRGRRQRRG